MATRAIGEWLSAATTGAWLEPERSDDAVDPVSSVALSRLQGVLQRARPAAFARGVSGLGQLHALCRIHSRDAHPAVRLPARLLRDVHRHFISGLDDAGGLP